MDKGWTLETIGGSAGVFHAIGHAGWAAGEDTDLWQAVILFLQVVEEGLEVRTTKVGHRAQAGEQTAAGQLLEVPLTDVL